MATKVCNKCRQEKPQSAFCRASRSPDGYHWYCKECIQAYDQQRRARTAELARARRRLAHPERAAKRAERDALAAQGLRRCNQCGTVKPFSEFYRCTAGANGLHARCKACERAHEQERAEARLARRRVMRRERNPEYYAERERIAALRAQGFKQCALCGQIKEAAVFAPRPSRASGLQSYCKDCMGEVNRNTDRGRQAWRKAYSAAHKDHLNERGRLRRERLRNGALDHYGGRCACCSEQRRAFLAIDHIGGGGSQHRREVQNGGGIYAWLRRQGYPEGFRVLCHNCNQAVGYYGACPHTQEQQVTGAAELVAAGAWGHISSGTVDADAPTTVP